MLLERISERTLGDVDFVALALWRIVISTVFNRW